jgi:hypothetical protein
VCVGGELVEGSKTARPTPLPPQTPYYYPWCPDRRGPTAARSLGWALAVERAGSWMPIRRRRRPPRRFPTLRLTPPGEGLWGRRSLFPAVPQRPLSTVLQLDAPASASPLAKTPTQKQWCDVPASTCPCHLAILTAKAARRLVGLRDGIRPCCSTAASWDEERHHTVHHAPHADLCRQCALACYLDGLGSRCATATSSGYSASTSIAFRSTTKYKAAPRAAGRHRWLTCSMGRERGTSIRTCCGTYPRDLLPLAPPHPSCTPALG